MTLFLMALSTLYSITLTARTPTVVAQGIFSSIFVPIHAVSLSSLIGKSAHSSKHVLFLSDGLQVVWSHARFVAAQVIEDHTLRSFAVCELIAKYMGPLRSAFGSWHVKHSVALGDSASPYPAGVGLFNLAPKLFHTSMVSVSRLAGQAWQT